MNHEGGKRTDWSGGKWTLGCTKRDRAWALGGGQQKKIKTGENFKTKPLTLYVNESKLIQIREK